MINDVVRFSISLAISNTIGGSQEANNFTAIVIKRSQEN